MTGFWKEIEQGARCVRLVEELLREEENILKHLKERGIRTASVEYRIARMKYALGQINIEPFWRDYYPPIKLKEIEL